MTAGAPPPAIVLRDASKTYHIQERASPRLGAWVVGKLFEHLRRTPFEALRGVSFEVPQGAMLGLLGANGSGKSTVLKLAAGITTPTRGEVRVRGRVAAMLELGIGFHPELTGMENIFYNGSLMGLKRSEILERLESIIAFAGLRGYLREPVKRYSSGMYARLACSVALHLDPDVVLVDEILAAGDYEFQQRGMLKLLDMHHSGATVLLVTHVLAAARDMCDRLIWLEDGAIRLDGEPKQVATTYARAMADRGLPRSSFLHPAYGSTAGDAPPGAPRILGADLLDAGGAPIEHPATGEPLSIVFRVDPGLAHGPWRLRLAARWVDGRVLFEDASPPQDPATEVVRYDIPRWPFRPDRVELHAALVEPGAPERLLDRRSPLAAFGSPGGSDFGLGEVVTEPAARWTVEALDP